AFVLTTSSSPALEEWLLRSATPDSKSLQVERSSGSPFLGGAANSSGSVKEGVCFSLLGVM
ncbi:hypothetical protein M9458_002683, partial [Cirrhinus mrigala]